MKKLWAVILAFLLLTGCAVQTPEASGTVPGTTSAATVPTTPPETTAPTAPQEDPGCYVPNSDLEVESAGTLKKYTPDLENIRWMDFWEDRLVVISGWEKTRLSVLDGNTLEILFEKDLGNWTSLEHISMNRQGIGYCDSQSREAVFLTWELTRIGTAALPEDFTGFGCLAPDWSCIYYCGQDGIRVNDLKTGVSRLLKAQVPEEAVLEGPVCDGKILHYADDSTGTRTYFSSETGESIREDSPCHLILSEGDSYAASLYDGSMLFYLCGDGEGEPKSFASEPGDYPVSVSDEYLIMAESDQTQTLLCAYDLESGKRAFHGILDSGVFIISLEERDDFYWIACQDGGTGEEYFCRWTPVPDSTANQTVVLRPYVTPDRPDLQGLGACRLEADHLERKYDVKILLGPEVLDAQPFDYNFTPEHQPAILERDLEILDHCLGQYPGGFLDKLTQDGEELVFLLARGIEGVPEYDTLASALGLQYWLEESVCVALETGSELERTVYHELCHVIDSRVFARSQLYDDWESLNPSGFEYDLDLSKNMERPEDEYLDGEERAFIDTYAMSFPNEDRARTMEYSMCDGCGFYYESEFMQQKLRRICLAIRESFELDGSQPYLWEQYLAEPILPEED